MVVVALVVFAARGLKGENKTMDVALVVLLLEVGKVKTKLWLLRW